MALPASRRLARPFASLHESRRPAQDAEGDRVQMTPFESKPHIAFGPPASKVNLANRRPFAAATISSVTPDAYVNQIVKKYAVDTGPQSAAYATAMAFKTVAEQWADKCLRSVTVSGSYAKLTVVSSSLAGRTDIDLFISLTSTTKQTFRPIFSALRGLVNRRRRRANISVPGTAWSRSNPD